MDPEDFRYRVADDGRIAIAGLTPEETLELEALFRWQDVTRDLPRELRLLELYLRHHATFTDRRRIIDAGSSASPYVRRRDVSSNGPRRARRSFPPGCDEGASSRRAGPEDCPGRQRGQHLRRAPDLDTHAKSERKLLNSLVIRKGFVPISSPRLLNRTSP